MPDLRRDLRGAPPPRYRVVERDRKLVVIDTTTGQADDVGSAAPATSWLPKQIQFDGSAELTTHAVYDDKGPRTIRLDPGSAATICRLKLTGIGIGFVLIVAAITWPWALLPAFLLWNRAIRVQLRSAATAWLDRVEREAG